MIDASVCVGINTAGASVANTGGGSFGLGFAIPIDLARAVADEPISNGKVARPSFRMQPAESVDALIVKTLKMRAGATVRLTYERRGVSYTTTLRLSAG